jgi:hypothetical protein
MRQMSFTQTAPQLLDRSKTVTRRLGWSFLKPGDRVQAVEQAQGLKRGEKVQRIAVLEIVSVTRGLLGDVAHDPQETAREGFPELSPHEFVAMFGRMHRGAVAETPVTRIEFRVVEDSQ